MALGAYCLGGFGNAAIAETLDDLLVCGVRHRECVVRYPAALRWYFHSLSVLPLSLDSTLHLVGLLIGELPLLHAECFSQPVGCVGRLLLVIAEPLQLPGHAGQASGIINIAQWAAASELTCCFNCSIAAACCTNFSVTWRLSCSISWTFVTRSAVTWPGKKVLSTGAADCSRSRRRGLGVESGGCIGTVSMRGGDGSTRDDAGSTRDGTPLGTG